MPPIKARGSFRAAARDRDAHRRDGAAQERLQVVPRAVLEQRAPHESRGAWFVEFHDGLFQLSRRSLSAFKALVRLSQPLSRNFAAIALQRRPWAPFPPS